MSYKKFLGVFLTATAAMIVCTAAFSVVVDPYDLFGLVRAKGFNRDKTEAYLQPFLVSTYQVERLHPATLLLGNSGVLMGLNPRSNAWPAQMQPIYNMGQAGVGPWVLLRFLQHTVATSRLHDVYVGLEFDDFLYNAGAKREVSPPARIGEFEHRLAAARDGSPNPERDLQRLSDFALAAVSLRGLRDSLFTLASQDDPEFTVVTPDGFNNGGQFRKIVRQEGHFALFQQKRMTQVQKVAKRVADDFAADSDPGLDFRALWQILNLCREKQIRVHLFIQPGHVEKLEIMRARLWRSVENWKRALVRLVDEFQARSDPGSYALWDFTSYRSYSTEVVPPRGDHTTHLRWWWEMNHYKTELGDLMIARMNGSGPSDFGAKLDGASVDTWLDSLNAQRSTYVELRSADRIPSAR